MDAALLAERVAELTDEEVRAWLAVEWQAEHRARYHKFDDLFPDDGPLRRALYPKHLEFFEAGVEYRERLAMCANRVGKTYSMGGYETTCHLTGLYPSWWVGKRFLSPIRAWACGKTNETTRDIVQNVLLGGIEYLGGLKRVDGTGLIPVHLIGRDKGQLTWKAGVADLVDTVDIKHASGGWSKLGLKSYQQGRGAFEGTAQHWIWDDEEPPMDVYGEQLIRTTTTRGSIILTFTPLAGHSDVVQAFLPQEIAPPKMRTKQRGV